IGSASNVLWQCGHSTSSASPFETQGTRGFYPPRHRPNRSVASTSMNEDMLRRGVAEFIGAFTLIFIGGGAGIVAGHYHAASSGLVGIALANGLAIGIMVTNLGHISGGHFNPAITLGFVVTRRISGAVAVVYWASQLLGATVAALILRYVFAKQGG